MMRQILTRSRLSVVVTVAVITVLFGITSFADWSQFRGPRGGRATDADPPIEWDESTNIAWKHEVGYGSSSPIVVGDQLFVTCYRNYGQGSPDGGRENLTCHTLCINRLTGETIWEKSIPAAEEERDFEGFVQEHGFASSTPASDGERVFSYFGATGLLAYSIEGEQLWHVDLGAGTNGFGMGASPIVFEDLVIVNASIESDSLVALNVETGDEVWRAEGIRRSWGTPAIVTTADGSPELVIYYQPHIKGFDPHTGEELWSFEGVNDYICPSVVVEGDIVYAVGGRRGACYAIRAGGRGDVTESHKLWEADVQTNVPSPVVAGDYLMWVAQQGRGACLNRHTGEVLSEERIEDSGGVYASLVSTGERLYLVTRLSGTFVLSPTPEMEVLAHNVIAGDDTDFNASPAVAGDMLYLRSNKFVYGIGIKQ